MASCICPSTWPRCYDHTLVRAIRAVRADAAPALLAEYRARSRDPLGG